MDNLSLEIRNKRLSRKDAIKYLPIKVVKLMDDIRLFCKFVGITVKEFEKISDKFRNKDIWKKVKRIG